jgi:hypothetical protein
MGGMAALFIPPKKAYKIEQIKPLTPVPGAKRMKILYGPYRLKAANVSICTWRCLMSSDSIKSTVKVGNGMSMDRGGTGYMNMVASDFLKDVTVLEVHSEVQTLDFKRASTDEGIYNHHNVFMDLTKPIDVFGCEDGIKAKPQPPMTVLGAGATEDGTFRFYAEDGAITSGFYLPNDRQILNMVDIINYNNEEKEIYTATEMEYLEGKPKGLVQASQQRVDPGTCGGPDGAGIHPPKGQQRFAVKSQNIIALRDGWITNARKFLLIYTAQRRLIGDSGGHMHDGGVNMVFTVNDKEVCNSKATYGGEGHVGKTAEGKVWETIAESSYCNTTFPVKKGDRIFMQANYDVGLHPS